MVGEKNGVKQKAVELANDWRRINYLQPFYDGQGGNSTLISLEPGETVVDRRSVKVVLKNLAKIFAVDLSAARQKFMTIVGRRSSAPVPLNAQLVLLPVKMRKALVKGDGAWGYVVLDKIQDLAEGTGPAIETGFKSQILFRDGSRLDTMVSQAAVYSLIRDGELVRQKYLELLGPQQDAGWRILEREGAYLGNSHCRGDCWLRHFLTKSWLS